MLFLTFYTYDTKAQTFETVFPANTQVLSDSVISFQWNKVQNISSYEIHVFSNSSLTNEVFFQTNILSESFFSTQLLYGSNYYWCVVAFYTSGSSDTSDIKQFSIFKPTLINNAVLWLDADSATISGINVTEWNDNSENNIILTQINSAFQPIIVANALNEKPVIRFDGVNDFFSFPSSLDLDRFSFFVVFKKNNASNTGIIIGKDNSGSCIANYNDGVNYIVGNTGYASVNGGHILDYSILSVIANGSLVKLFQNKSMLGTEQAFNYQISLNAIGQRNYSQFIDGDIAEILIYDIDLNLQQRLDVENYLHWKYAPSVNLGSNIYVPYGYGDTLIDAGNNFTNYIWSNGQTTQIATVSETGIYSVTVTDVFGFTSSDSVHVFYPDPISPNDLAICMGDTFIWDSGLGSGYTYNWSDGSTDTSISIFAQGQYFLTVTDSLGHFKLSDTLIVSIDSFPIIASLGNDRNLCSGNKISLVDGNAVTFLWPDGSFETEYAVDTSGYYWLIAINENGCIGQDTVFITVTGNSPIPVFSINDTCSGQTTQFINTSYTVDGSNIIGYNWQFGDSNLSNLVNPQHVYENTGSFVVSLQIITDAGCQSDTTALITILPKPHAAFSSLSNGCLNNAIVFEDLSYVLGSDTIISWSWSFGDSGTSLLSNPSHSFTQVGNFDVSLTVQASNQCYDSIINSVSISNFLPYPETFDLLFPINGFSTVDNFTVCAWDTSINAILYKIELSDEPGFTSISYSSYTQNHSTNIPLSINGDVYWRVKSYNHCNDSISSETRKISRILPNGFSNLVFWLIANNETNGTSDIWNDISAANNSPLQTNSDFIPELVNSAIDTFSVFRFDGVNDFYQLPNDFILDSLSLIVVYKKNIEANTGLIIGDSESQNCMANYTDGNTYVVCNTGYNSLPTGHMLEYNIFSITIGDDVVEYYINKILFGTFNINGFQTNISTIGQRGNNEFLSGDIAEIILFSRNIQNSERILIEDYLHKKYAPPVTLGRDIYSERFCSVAIESSDRYVDYQWSTTQEFPEDTLNLIYVNKPGVYAVTVTDIFGYTSIDSINVFYPDQMQDAVFCANDSILLNPPVSGSFSYLWSNGSTSQQSSYFTGGIFWIEITDDLLCTRRDTFELSVDSISFHASLGPDTTLCSGNPLSLQSGGDEAVSYSWWPGGQTAPEITVYNTGLYVLTVLSENGCEAKDSVDVYIQGVAPIPGFTTQNLCFGDTIVFTDTSLSLDLSNVVSWVWTFPDATQMTGPVAEKVLGAAGLYPVVLTITTDSSCSSTMTKQVQVFPLPEPQFVWTNPCTGLPLVFTNQSTISLGQVVDYFWILDNTDTSYIENPTFYPETETEISVYMQATSNLGCWQDTSLSIYIKKSPVALFDISPSCSEKVTYFFDLSEATIIHPIMQWNWSLGIAGVTTQQQNPNYTYLSPGVYPVSLQVRSLNGCTDTYLKSVSVSANPIAGFSGMEVCEGLPLIISDTSTTVNGTIIQRTWEVDAMGAYSDSSISVVFPDSGDYAVELFVTSELYCTDSVRKIVRVHPLPMADFIMDKDFGPVPLLVQFDNESSNGSYLWAFGDGHSSTLTNPQHLYLNIGEYTVQMEVTDSNGCRQTGSNSVSVVSDLYDLVLFGMDTIIEGDIKKVVLYIANSGSLPVTNPLVLISAGQTMLYSETMNQTLQPGQIYSYTMASGTYLPNDNSGAYVCAKILLPQGQIDVNMTNNEFCLARENGLLLLRVFPNPVSEELVIEFSSEKEMKGSVQITNTTGKRVLDAEITMSKGFNRLLLNVSNYDQGMYFLNLSDQNSNIFYKFAKN